MEKYSFAINDEAKEALSKQIEDLKAPAEPEETVIYTLNGIDLKRLIDALDLGKARLEPNQELRFSLGDRYCRVIMSNKIVIEKEDGWKAFQPDTYIEYYDFEEEE